MSEVVRCVDKNTRPVPEVASEDENTHPGPEVVSMEASTVACGCKEE